MEHTDTSSKDPPNLSDCHGCGVRINHTNPKDRLQPMNSMWRIVLLCKTCTKRVNSSDLCPYCFTPVVNQADCFKCSDCERNIHKACVKQYDLKLGFSVCVDCWIPEAFGISIKAKRNLRNRNPNLTESDFYAGEVERQIAVAEKASEIALMKAVVAKNAVELAKGILSVVRCRKVVDDAELAVLLQRAISSSPRISRYAWFGSSVRRDDVSVTCYSRRRAGKDNGTFGVSLMCYSRRRVKNSVSLNAVGSIDMKTNRCPLKYYRIGKGKSRPSLFDTWDFGNGYECGEVCEKVDDDSNRFLLKYKRISRSKPSNHPMKSTTLSDVRPCSSSQGEV